MSNINEALKKISEGISELFEVLTKVFQNMAEVVTENFEKIAKVTVSAASTQESQKPKERMRAKRPDYKQHQKAQTKPIYRKQIRKSTGKRGV